MTSQEDVGAARPVLDALALPVLVCVAVHQLTGDRVALSPEPVRTVDGIRMICPQ